MNDFQLSPDPVPRQNSEQRPDEGASDPDAPRSPAADDRDATHSPDQPAQLALWPAEPAAASANPEAAAPLAMAAPDSSSPDTSSPDSFAPQQAVPHQIDPPWTLLDVVGFVAFAAIAFVAAQFAAVFVYSLLRPHFFPNVPMEQVMKRTPWLLALQLVWELACMAFIYFMITKKYQRDFWEAVKWKQQRYQLLYAAAGAALAVLSMMLSSILPERHLPIEKAFSSPESAYLLAFFGIFVAPFVEEMIFRGFLYPVLERLWGLVAAVLLTTALFAGIHAPQLSGGSEEIAAIFVVGFVFSYVRGKSGSLVPSFVMHTVYNSVLFVSLYLSTDYFRALRN